MSKRHEEVTQAQVMADHLKELRIRLLVCIGIAAIGGVVGYIFYQPILGWLRSPLHADLYYNTPAGSFTFVMKVVSMVGIGLALPALIYNLLMFVQPALKRRFSGIRITVFTLFSIVLAAGGAAFAFYTILPGALKFFGGFQVSGLSALISADSYLSFVTNALITFMIVFQIPLLMIIFDRIKPIQPKKLFAMEKYVILGGFVIAMVVPFAFDLVTCLLIAAPIIVLYNLSVLMIMLQHLQRRYAAKRKGFIPPDDDQYLDDELIAEFLAEQRDNKQRAPLVAPMPAPAPARMVASAPVKPAGQTARLVSTPSVVQAVSRTHPAQKLVKPIQRPVDAMRPVVTKTTLATPVVAVAAAQPLKAPQPSKPHKAAHISRPTVIGRRPEVARPVISSASPRYVAPARPVPVFVRPQVISSAPATPTLTLSTQRPMRLISGIQ